MTQLLTMITCIVLLTACMPTDSPITPHPRTSNNCTVELGEFYGVQAFVDLSTNQIVKQTPIDSWHLSVDCSIDEHTVRLNDALIMSAAPTGTTDWNSVTKRPKDGYLFEPATGSADSLPLRNFWASTGNNEVYVLHLGTSISGKDLGYRKIQGIVSSPQATIRLGSLDGTTDTVITLTCNSAYRRTAVNLVTAEQIQAEPPTTDWDVLLTRYTYMFHTETGPLPYAVVGVLLNQPLVRAVQCPISYHDLAKTDTAVALLTERRDAIGHEWKSFDLQTDVYTVDTAAAYLVRDRFGYLRALRFLDFYDGIGRKGTITFEHRIL